MSNLLYICGLFTISSLLASYVSIIKDSETAWRWAIGFLVIAAFVFAVDWILSKTEKIEQE